MFSDPRLHKNLMQEDPISPAGATFSLCKVPEVIALLSLFSMLNLPQCLLSMPYHSASYSTHIFRTGISRPCPS